MSQATSTAGRVTREQRGQVLLIGLDRATKRNAFDSAMLEDLSRALGEYERDEQLRCAVLFAHGEHFTAGLDLMELTPKLASGGIAYPEDGIDPWGVIGPRRSKPVVMAVQGACWTAGIELLLNADIAIAASNARFAQLEVLRGISPAGGATLRFPRVAGWTRAMRYMLTGEEFDAATALDMGLLVEVVAPEHLLARAIDYAERIAKAAPLAVRATLQSAFLALEQGEEAALAQLNPQLMQQVRSEDAREGVMAMLQKRQPVFLGR
ncbi:crotonase/enoyl-CoA hydratase family protein [Pseudomonas piscis]|uniref:crotonase/enoyl-CoA hydratase family protein n=1 Tax=Pseudomonas piscis TaxID=2614538 RepID=UPI00384EBAD5